MIKVQVLMSTYNGQAYVREQLDSILAQEIRLGEEKIKLSLLVRDDGSRDNTVEILKEYSQKFPQITYVQGENMGACKSFFELIKWVGHDVDYISFSDQDDVWNKNKIRRAISGLRKYKDIPAMYASELEIVNQHLEMLVPLSNNRRYFSPSFGNALIENICTGCTIVINRKLYEIVGKAIPSHAYMHDWWIYLTASCFGKVLYDKKAFIKYRQHETNTIGSAVSYWQLIKKRVENFHDLSCYVPMQIREFMQIFELPEEKRQLAEKMLVKHKDLKERFKIFGCKEITRKSKIDTIIYKIGYLFW